MQRMEVEQAFGTPQDRMIETEYIISRKRPVGLAGVEPMRRLVATGATAASQRGTDGAEGS